MSDDPSEKLAKQADKNLQTLLADLDKLSAKVDAESARLTQIASQFPTPALNFYNIFKLGPPTRYIVLRDITDLNGQPPVNAKPYASFAEAIAWVNQHLSDPVAPHHHPPSPPNPSAPKS